MASRASTSSTVVPAEVLPAEVPAEATAEAMMAEAPNKVGPSKEPVAAPVPLAAGVPVAAGDLVAGKYLIERVIGAGGVGVVMEAMHQGLGERVAIKFLQKRAAESDENLTRFRREVRALAKIKSENVARVMDSGSLPSGEPFMVMELLEGQDLAAVLKARGRVSLAEAVDFIVQACEALAVAHGLSIVHRDIKPANLFLSRAADGTPIVKVLDFGISKLLGDVRDQAVTQTLSVIGSPLYMSPEQMERPRDADARSDIWSLGVILYELVTGKPPFEAATMPMLCARICTAPPTPLHVHQVSVPAALETAIARCLEKAPERRFPSVASLARAIAPFGSDSTRSKAEHVARIAEAEGLPDDSEDTQVMSGPPVGAATDGVAAFPASDADGQPESLPPRRLAWDSSPPPPPTASLEPVTRPRRARLVSASIAALCVLLAIAVWMRGREPQSVARPAARMLADAPARELVELPTAAPATADAQTLVPAAAATVAERATSEPAPDATPLRPKAGVPRKPALPKAPVKPSGRHDDVLSER
jgi:eukaryotic-like serine/threonine-protein kinase